MAEESIRRDFLKKAALTTTGLATAALGFSDLKSCFGKEGNMDSKAQGKKEAAGEKSRKVILAAVQTCCEVGDVAKNLANGEKLIRSAADQGAKFVCLPELFTTGAANNLGDLAEVIPGPTTRELGRIAKENSVYLVAGIAEKDEKDGAICNSSVLIGPDGKLLSKYRKVFLYLIEKEIFKAGDKPSVGSLPFGNIGITICYDYVFPEYMRYLVSQDIELLVHSTAWLTTADCEKWNYNNESYRAMGMSRALENGIYFISANHWGQYDSVGNLKGIGQSCIISPWGEILAEVREGSGIAIAEVDFDKPADWRKNIAPYTADYKAAEKRLDFLPKY